MIWLQFDGYVVRLDQIRSVWKGVTEGQRRVRVYLKSGQSGTFWDAVIRKPDESVDDVFEGVVQALAACGTIVPVKTIDRNTFGVDRLDDVPVERGFRQNAEEAG